MLLFDLLKNMMPDLKPEDSKLHLATADNDGNNPLSVYYAGKFNDWQSWQSNKNFERPYVISLIRLTNVNHWLFVGVYHSNYGYLHVEKDTKLHRYKLVEDERCSEMNGRIVVSFERPSRQAYYITEKWLDKISLVEIKSEPLTINKFSGYKTVDLSKQELNTMIRLCPESWQTALSNVSAVYLISDTHSGKLYVGSAYGQNGLWQRWASYVENGHGGNKILRQLIETDQQYQNYFRYSILEIFNIDTGQEEILQRESHWKNILQTRTFGLNGN